MANPEKMKFVVDSLSDNPHVILAKVKEVNNLATGAWPSSCGSWSRTMDLFAYPVYPIYDAELLNDFMFDLVPELEPNRSDRFVQYQGDDRKRGDLLIGRLYFDEVIGTAALSATVKLDSGLSVVESGALDTEWTSSSTIQLYQRTWLRVFPDAGHAADAANGVNEVLIPGDELGRHPKQHPIQV